jgi:small-conductance mechanosensitive channel
MSFQPVLNSLMQILLQILNFLPRFINGLLILIVGYLISALIRWLIRFVLQHIHLQELADRVGIVSALRSLGIRAPLSEIIAQIVFFFLILSFATSAVRLMGLSTVADLLNSILNFVPKAISAAILILFGSMLARFLGNTVSAVADTVNLSYSKALGKIIEYAIVAFIIVLAVSTLGLDTTVLTTSLTIIIAAVGLTVALTFGLGSREAIRNVIAGFYVRQNFRPGQRVTLRDYSGTIRSIAGAYTVLETVNAAGQSETISLPNLLLLENVVRGEEPQTS